MIVYTAVRKRPGGGSVVGYFKTKADIPDGWTPCASEQDIAPIMVSLNVSDPDRCLEIMNQHWKEPVLGPRCPEMRHN